MERALGSSQKSKLYYDGLVGIIGHFEVQLSKMQYKKRGKLGCYAEVEEAIRHPSYTSL